MLLETSQSTTDIEIFVRAWGNRALDQEGV